MEDVEDYGVDPLYKDLLVEYLSQHTIRQLKDIFDEAPKSRLRKLDLKLKVLDTYSIPFTNEELDRLFTKMDYDKDDGVTWDEFISFLLLELKCKQMDSTEPAAMEPPIVDMPTAVKSRHRDHVIHVELCSTVKPDRTVDNDDGRYITMSKEGTINFWTMDFKLLRSFKDKSPLHKVKQTWVTRFTCMPDINYVVTSSTERELRFYNTAAKGFSLKFIFTIMPYCINHLNYYFSKDPHEDSILVCGDLGGNMRVMYFNSRDRGPFKPKVGVDVLILKWEHVVKGQLKGLHGVNMLGLHTDWVRQVAYYKLLNCVVSCSTSPEAMFIGDYLGLRKSYNFSLVRGIETFAVNEHTPMVVTGSLDCRLRLWNPFFNAKPTAMLEGHHASIVCIFLYEEGTKIISVDKDRAVRIWSSQSLTCMQIYNGFSMDAVSQDLCGSYSEASHLLVLGGPNIQSVVVERRVDELRTDGMTHTEKVSVVLFNRLYRCVVTCGYESTIIAWDIWNNRLRNCIRMAHTHNHLGLEEGLPITAATFDPLYQLLLTGSIDGNVKIWDFNTSTCLKTLTVQKGSAITKVIWLRGRILCIGWNQRVVEFSDNLMSKETQGKPWELRHNDDMLSGDYRTGQALATCTFNGDLIFWRLETGQSYRRFNVTYPTGLFKLEYVKETDEGIPKLIKKKAPLKKRKNLYNLDEFNRLRYRPPRKKPGVEKVIEDLERPELNLLKEKHKDPVQRPVAVHCLKFLRSRDTLPDQGTVLTAIENGTIQVWSHHPNGGFLTAFKAVHMRLDYVVTMDTDPEDEFLFIGTVTGYIKVWLLKNYCLTETAKVEVCMPEYRLKFPFLINDRFLLRAKAAVRGQPLPVLLSSYRGHKGAVLYVEYVHENKILLTASVDKTARVWTLSGRYIGTLGQRKPWLTMEYGVDPDTQYTSADYRLPPDLVRTSSHTTLKVWKGAPPVPRRKSDMEVDLSVTAEDRRYGIYGKRLSKPYLGNFHSLPERSKEKKSWPVLDSRMDVIPVFEHLILPPAIFVERPPTPEMVQAARVVHTTQPFDDDDDVDNKDGFLL